MAFTSAVCIHICGGCSVLRAVVGLLDVQVTLTFLSISQLLGLTLRRFWTQLELDLKQVFAWWYLLRY